MEVVLGTYNKVNANGRAYKVGSKDNLLRMIEEAKKRQGGKLLSELGNPTIKPDEHPADFQHRCITISLDNVVGNLDDIVVEESPQTNEDIKHPILTIKANIDVSPNFKGMIDSESEFCLRGLTRRNKIIRVITWDHCCKSN